MPLPLREHDSLILLISRMRLVGLARTLAHRLSLHSQRGRGSVFRLAVLEAANLVATIWHGRQKLHFLNPVPLQGMYGRWIAKFERPRLRQSARAPLNNWPDNANLAKARRLKLPNQEEMWPQATGGLFGCWPAGCCRLHFKYT